MQIDWIGNMGIVLFENKKTCCGCSACASICPKGAIEMKPDDQGFIYPVINPNLCVSCGACKKVCAYQNENSLHEPVRAYAAVNKNRNSLQNQLLEVSLRRSRHIFWKMAELFLERHLILKMDSQYLI